MALRRCVFSAALHMIFHCAPARLYPLVLRFDSILIPDYGVMAVQGALRELFLAGRMVLLKNHTRRTRLIMVEAANG